MSLWQFKFLRFYSTSPTSIHVCLRLPFCFSLTSSLPTGVYALLLLVDNHEHYHTRRLLFLAVAIDIACGFVVLNLGETQRIAGRLIQFVYCCACCAELWLAIPIMFAYGSIWSFTTGLVIKNILSLLTVVAYYFVYYRRQTHPYMYEFQRDLLRRLWGYPEYDGRLVFLGGGDSKAE